LFFTGYLKIGYSAGLIRAQKRNKGDCLDTQRKVCICFLINSELDR